MNPDPDELSHRFHTREEQFEHGKFTLEVLLPAAPEDLIDEREFEDDERLPYWADLWPSARALTRFLLDDPPPANHALELGAGLGLPSLALRWLGHEVLATDWYADALRFAEANAARLGLSLSTRLLDWRSPPPDLGRWNLVVAADVLYEQRNAHVLAPLLRHLVAPGGCVLVADPGRIYLGEFLNLAREHGWNARRIAVREEAPSRVQIWQLRRADS